MPAEEFDMPDDEQRPPQGKGVLVQFFKHMMVNPKKSLEAGRRIHDELDFIRKQVAGDRTNIIERPATEEDKREHRAQWKAYVENESQDKAMGQPLSDWPGIPANLAEDYKAVGIRTVEQLAECPDGNLQNLGPLARKYQQKARAFIEAAKGDAPLLLVQEELQKERAAREQRDKEFQALLAEVQSLRQALAVMTPAAVEDGKRKTKG